MTTSTAAQFSEPISHHGEGPIWLGAQGLAVLDMLAGDVVLLDARGQRARVVHVDDVVAAVRPRRGGYVAGIERGFCLLDDDLAVTDRVDAWSDPALRMNDGGCDPHGRFWCGSMAYDLTPSVGALWRYDPDGSITEVVSGIGCSNGLAWTADGSRAYYVDSLTERIDVLRTDDDGQVTSREPFFDVAGQGFPDGVALDREDGVWLALFGSGRLIHVDRLGNQDHVIEVPVAQVTACTFGGADFTELYITTSAYGLDTPERLAGAVFVSTPQVPGFAPFRFGGEDLTAA